jgi:hypothetical protein
MQIVPRLVFMCQVDMGARKELTFRAALVAEKLFFNARFVYAWRASSKVKFHPPTR